MFLKRLSCQGFKSFADRIDFDFQPGITGIVGPNGCGKSNVVDAIKWVLGDQSPRSLRGKQMQDVIFSGSGTRRSAGMAQVDLLLDNRGDRRLACDADEVLITRRLYRSGESEYLINNETVRLRDVRELFMDTGVGLGAYSIIEQGKVDVLLQANPQERRVIFEEAAGISRYKARRKEAQRKLERVAQNLLRVEDILDEVEKRLRSIKYQAAKARHWQEYDRQLREKRATYALAEYHRLTQKQAALVGEMTQSGDEATRHRTTIASAEARIATLDGELLRHEGEIRQVEQQILANASEITAGQERIEQSHQRLEELGAARARAQQRLAVERLRAARVRRQIEVEESASTALEDQLRAANSAVDALAEEDRTLARDGAALTARSEDEKAGIIDLLRRGSHLHNEIQSLQERGEQLEAEKGRLRARAEQVGTELRELQDGCTRAQARGAEIAHRIEVETAKLHEKQEQAAHLDADRAELHAQLAAAKEYRSGLISRRNLLSDLDRRREGVDAGVRELLHRREQDPAGQVFGYVRGMVADLIAAEVANAVLIETALGEYDQYVVVEHSQAFFHDAATLADFPGQVTAICLDRLPPFVDGRDFTGQAGFVAYATDLVRYEPDTERLVRHLLGKTVIVRTLGDALRLAEQNPPTYRYVTLSGELLDPEGRCQLGPPGTRTGLISRKSELREIDVQIVEVQERIAVMADGLERTSGELAQLEKIQDELRQAIYEARTAEIENNAGRAGHEAAIQRLTQQQPLIAGEMKSIEMQIAEAAERSARSGALLQQIEQERGEREQRVRELAGQIDALIQRRSQLAERLTDAKVTVGRLGQQRSMLADALRGLQESYEASAEAVRTSTQEAEDAVHRITMAERTILAAQSRLAELFSIKERLDQEALAQRHRRERMRFEMEQLTARVKSDRSALAVVEERLHRLDMELQEVRIRIHDLAARIRDELGIDLAEQYAGYQHRDDQDWHALEAEIEELKEKIRRLGNVNLDAIAEQEDLEKRLEFLGSQHDDLRKAQRQLEELIEQLNTECRERFTRTFEAVRGHFQELFRKLFGGGKADILLESPPEGQPLDVLEAGIDIQARPPGKELQNISLLSGGEKTMTAIALLLAIFRSRPSPFAILDEVDAALDEANNERFNRIVQEFLDQSQFIIITHAKRTMAMTDVLYGVTMQEAGVSTRVSVRFDTEEPRSAAVA